MARRIEKAKIKHDLFVKKLTIDLLTRIVLKSPVDTGRFRANWVVGNAAINRSTSEATDKSGSSTITSGTYEINSININGQTIYVTNSLPYAYRLEYDGWSQQAPAGMVRLSIIEMDAVARMIGAELRMA